MAQPAHGRYRLMLSQLADIIEPTLIGEDHYGKAEEA